MLSVGFQQRGGHGPRPVGACPVLHRHIGRVPGQVTGAQRLGDSTFVDQPSTATVDEIAAALHARQSRGVEEVLRLRRQRKQREHEVSFGQELIQRAVATFVRRNRAARIRVDDRGAESRQPSSQSLSQLSKAHDPSRRPRHPSPVELGAPARESAAADLAVARQDVARDGQQESHRQVGGRLREQVGHDREPHAPPRARRDVEVVEPLQRRADDLQARARFQKSVVDRVGHEHDQRVGVAAAPADLGRVQSSRASGSTPARPGVRPAGRRPRGSSG